MIGIIKAQDRHFNDFGWLQTYWLFSFSDYFDPRNLHWGALRVFNDDVVQPGTGFPTHPHEEMEIITIVLQGEMTHADSLGNKTVIKAGEVQRMSAGTGLTHSEFNLAKEPVHFYQIWISPNQTGLRPSYDQKAFAPAHWKNELFPVASGQKIPEAVQILTEATIYRCDLETGKKVTFSNTAGRRIFVYLTNGCLSVNGQIMEAKDQARIELTDPLVLEAHMPSGLILIDTPPSKTTDAR